MTETVLIVGISSDIGLSLANNLVEQGFRVSGTYRRKSTELKIIESELHNLFEVDVGNQQSLNLFEQKINEAQSPWDYIICCPATLEPIGDFLSTDFMTWKKSFDINLFGPLDIVKRALLRRNNSKELCRVIFFAGGGVNGVTPNLSAYTIAKIALIKTVELLESEIKECNFVIVGPGWVRTKIHDEVIMSADPMTHTYQETERRLSEDDFIPMNRVVNYVKRLMTAPSELIGGRNFSVVQDDLDNDLLIRRLADDGDAFKLRRAGNDWQK